MRACDSNISAAARKAGMDRSNFKRVLRKYRLGRRGRRGRRHRLERGRPLAARRAAPRAAGTSRVSATMRSSEPVSSWPSSTTSSRAPGVRATQASTSSSGTVSSRRPAMQSAGTSTSGKARPARRVLEERPADPAGSVRGVVVDLHAALPAPAFQVGRAEPRSPPLVKAEGRGEQHQPLDRRVARGRQRGEPAAQRAADDGVRPGLAARRASASASIEDGVLRSNPSGPGVRSARTTTRPSDGEPLRDRARLGRPGSRGETVQVQDHEVSFALPQGVIPMRGERERSAPAAPAGYGAHSPEVAMDLKANTQTPLSQVLASKGRGSSTLQHLPRRHGGRGRRPAGPQQGRLGAGDGPGAAGGDLHRA